MQLAVHVTPKLATLPGQIEIALGDVVSTGAEGLDTVTSSWLVA